MSLEVTCGFFEYLLQFAQRGALFLVRLNRVFDLMTDQPMTASETPHEPIAASASSC